MCHTQYTVENILNMSPFKKPIQQILLLLFSIDFQYISVCLEKNMCMPPLSNYKLGYIHG